MRTLPRIKNRRKSNRWMKVGMVLFFIGLLAILADLVLFISGARPLPVWLNLTALLAPVGFAIGLVGTVVETRAATKARQAEEPTTDDEQDGTPAR